MADQELSRHFLYPGNLYVSASECLITTVLGSCVAVCLWDPALQAGGMNHYMLPLWNGEGLATPKYGSIAMDKLLDKMLALGCNRLRLIAKVFGGANMSGTGHEILMIGDRNITLAMQTLEEWKIPVVASDLGGKYGRKLIMNTATGEVLLGRNNRSLP